MPCCSEKMGWFGGAVSACSLSTAQCLSVSSATSERDGNLISACGTNIYNPLCLLIMSVKHRGKN